MITIGVDEVGRGSLMSIVAVCAYVKTGEVVYNVRDSKKMSETKRISVCQDIIDNGMYTFAHVDETFIDKHNILMATMYCMRKAIEELIQTHNITGLIKIYIDGDKNPYDDRYKKRC